MPAKTRKHCYDVTLRIETDEPNDATVLNLVERSLSEGPGLKFGRNVKQMTIGSVRRVHVPAHTEELQEGSRLVREYHARKRQRSGK